MSANEQQLQAVVQLYVFNRFCIEKLQSAGFFHLDLYQKSKGFCPFYYKASAVLLNEAVAFNIHENLECEIVTSPQTRL